MSLSENRKEFDYIWKFENFSMLPHQNGEALKSPEFEVDGWEGIKWYLELFLRGRTDEEQDYVSCFLKSNFQKIMKDFEVSCIFTIESTDPAKERTEKVDGKLCNYFENALGTGICSLSEIRKKKEIYLPKDVLSLRCHCSPVNSNNVEATVNSEIERATTNHSKTVYACRTVIQVQLMSFMWAIPNTSIRRERVETTFSAKDTPALKVTLNFSEITDNDSIPIEIQQTASAQFDEKKERLFVKCKITVGKEIQYSKESTHFFKLALNDVWHFPPFIKTSNLTLGKYLRQKDTLYLQCEFALSYKSGVYHCDEKPFAVESTKQAETSNWSASVKNIFASGKFSDVQIKAGGETFPAHKLVLCARSSVFSAMFDNDMKEKNSGVVEIDDVDPSTLKRMLTFIHFDDMTEKDICIEDVCKLYRAADKYNIVSLKGWCSKSLMSSLWVDSVYDVLFLADAHQDKFLMTMACNFIRCHKTEIFETSEWESLMDSYPKLSAKVMYHVFVNKKQF